MGYKLKLNRTNTKTSAPNCKKLEPEKDNKNPSLPWKVTNGNYNR
jgi:hypothetical protein